MMTPMNDRIIIKRDEPVKESDGGLILEAKKENIGEVVAVGAGHILNDGTRLPLLLKVGDRVVFAKMTGTDIEIDNEQYIIIKEMDILGKLENNLGS